MKKPSDVWQGTLSIMVLKTLAMLGPQHGYGLARRIEATSDDLLSINQGTLYPVLLKLEQEGAITAEWGLSENRRRAKFYRITVPGRRELKREEEAWARTNRVIANFSNLGEEVL